MNLLRALITVCGLLLATNAWADPVTDAQLAELERARHEIAGQVQLSAYDLVDELVYGLKTDPVFDKPTPVVLAGVTVPVGLGTGMQALLENHISSVLASNPSTNIQLAHCPTCSAVIVHSSPAGTVVSRGFDNPQAMAELGASTGQHALFIDVEAEGTWLVLRARLTQLTPDLPIVWSHTVATSAGTPALLRESTNLKSAADARQEYLNVLQSRGPIAIPIRFAVRSYARPNGQRGTAPPPFIWLQSGVEMGTTDAKVWTGSMLVGYSFVPQAYMGVMAQGRISRLLTGRTRSLTRPDLYLFVGGAVMNVWGDATASFQDEPFNLDQVLVTDSLVEVEPRNMFGGLHVGLDLRIGNRMGFSFFLENLPSLNDSKNLGRYVQFGIGFQSLGTEVSLWF